MIKFDFAEAIEILNQQPKEFWLKYAGETLYFRISGQMVLYHSMDFSLVNEYAKRQTDPDIMIVPVPSAEQIKKKFKREEGG